MQDFGRLQSDEPLTFVATLSLTPRQMHLTEALIIEAEVPFARRKTLRECLDMRGGATILHNGIPVAYRPRPTENDDEIVLTSGVIAKQYQSFGLNRLLLGSAVVAALMKTSPDNARMVFAEPATGDEFDQALKHYGFSRMRGHFSRDARASRFALRPDHAFVAATDMLAASTYGGVRISGTGGTLRIALSRKATVFDERLQPELQRRAGQVQPFEGPVNMPGAHFLIR